MTDKEAAILRLAEAHDALKRIRAVALVWRPELKPSLADDLFCDIYRAQFCMEYARRFIDGAMK